MTHPSPHFPPSFRQRAGFSLVEVVLAVGIIAFCLVALMGLLAVSMNVSRDSANATTDSLLFQKIINQLRVASINRDDAQSGDTDLGDRFPLPAAGEEGSTTFTVDNNNRYIADGAATSNPNAARVVTVSVMTPGEFQEENALDPVSLSSDGPVASVQVTVEPAHGSTDSTSKFSTELNLVLQ